MRASRLLSIMMMLQARRSMTAPALAKAHEVSERTILRDLDHLSAAGVPLWSNRGRNGGFQLRQGWSTELTGFTENEASALMLAGLPGPATDLGLGAAATSARLKMIASLPSEWREQADRMAARLHIDPVDWYRAQETPRFLREIAEAVWNGQRVEVRYQSWERLRSHVLDPLGLVLKAGAWYLVARPENSTRLLTYRLANVVAFTATGRRVVRPKGFDLARHWRDSLASFEKDLQRLQAQVRVSPRALTWLANDRVRYALLPSKGEPKNREHWRTILMPIESIEQGVRRFLSYGREIDVLGPYEVSAAYRREVEALSNRVRES
jgi:predicted DNA-binding transcriptional regulator YafY